VHPSHLESFVASEPYQAERHYGSKWRNVVITYALIEKLD